MTITPSPSRLVTAGILIAALVLPSTTAATTEAELKALQANESPESLWTDGDWWRDPKAYERHWQRRQAKWLNKHYEWGAESDPSRRVLILDPPLPRTNQGEKRVQVEWFYAPLGQNGTETASATANILAKWAQTLRPWDPDGVPVTMHHRLVGRGPTLLRQHDTRRRIAQELLYSHTDGTDWRYDASGASVHRAMYTHPDILESRATARAAIERLGLAETDDKARVERRITASNQRFLELMTRARDQNPRAVRTPWDPILLIDGKYLLTGGLIPRPNLLLRMANRIIRLQTEALSQSHVYGRPQIIDGDELVLQGQRIRLDAIRVPPDTWCARYGLAHCAMRARRALQSTAGNGRLRCAWDTSETVAAGAQPARCEFRLRELWPCRHPAQCSISRRMVATGRALAADTAGELHNDIEHRAARLKRGMWQQIPATARRDAPRGQPRTPVQALRATDRSAITWSNEHAPDPATIMVLDPPLPRSGIHDAVEVELYSTMIDDDGASHMDQCARELVLKVWWPSIEKTKAPVSLKHRLVDEGPGLDSRYHESRRRIGELVTGGAWYMNQDDERGLTVIRRTLEHLQTHKVREFTETDIKEILTAAGIETGEWENDAREEIETARTRANARWAHLAQQYLDRVRWTARTAAPLGRDASPIMVIDGKYLLTMNTIGEQGEMKATERLFQTANRLIRKELEAGNLQRNDVGKTANEERKMNYTAAVLATATAFLIGCGATTMETGGTTDTYPNWKGLWKRVTGPAEISPDAAHIRMKESGDVLRIVGLTPLKGAEAEKAHRYLSGLIKGKRPSCIWPEKPAAEGDPRAVSKEGYPLASCTIRTQSYRGLCRKVPKWRPHSGRRFGRGM